MSESIGVCAGCSSVLDLGAAFCNSCGRPVAGTQAGVITASPARPAVASFGEDFLARDRNKRMKRAANWLLGLSILFVIFGTGFGLYNMSQAKEARQILADLDDEQVLTVEGDDYTVAELKTKIDREVYMVFGLNYFLAVVMFGLYLWARKAPYPAMVTGLCTYLAVIVLNAVIDPKTLAQGILIKVLFISAMVAGIKAALEERDRAPAAPPPVTP